jgi:outer membrane protein assembly factor BamB
MGWLKIVRVSIIPVALKRRCSILALFLEANNGPAFRGRPLAARIVVAMFDECLHLSNMRLKIPVLLSLFGFFLCHSNAGAAPTGWFSWRGPNQNGTSAETNLPSTLDASHPLWTADFPGQSTAVAYNGRIYIMGYLGTGPDLSEGVACFDANTGQKLWQKLYLDFLSDTIYTRYSTSSPTIDPETGNVYIQDTQGIFAGFTPDGKVLWEHSLMEEYGRLTFPQRPHRLAGGGQGFGHHARHHGQLGRARAGGGPLLRLRQKDRPSRLGLDAGRTAQGQFLFPSRAGVAGRQAGLLRGHRRWRGGLRQCAHGQPIFQIPLFKAGINASVLLHKDDEIIAIYGTPYEPGKWSA